MWKRVLLLAMCALILAVGGGVAYLFARKPAMAPPRDVKVALTPERVERGRYLFSNLYECTGCHSERDFSKFAAPVKPDGLGKGFVFPDQMRLPGRIVSANLTPDPETGLGKWTDGEIIRAIREGVDRDGKALFAFMPYTAYRSMSDDDVEAIVAYLRTIPAIHNPLPSTQLALPVELLNRGEPKPVAGPVTAPPRSDALAYGRYLVTTVDCAGCHTMKKNGTNVEGMDLAGGFELSLPEGTVFSANITPDMETGIGSWTEDGFVARFRQYRDFAQNGAPSISRESFTLMPWLAYAELEEEDLRAMYRYLRTVKPVRHKVNTHPARQISQH
ncbi:MAG: cytochrome c [Bryobacterales bacterium]|nr:cytochrome c [Bryobacterales bacterium]